MSGIPFLVWALIGIIAVLGPIALLYKSDAGYGAIGVLSGAVITWRLERLSVDNWVWAAVFTLVALVLYIIGHALDDDNSKARPYFWAALLLGLFGALLPALVGLKWKFDPGEMTLPIGWLLLLIVIAIFAVIGLLTRGSQKGR